MDKNLSELRFKDVKSIPQDTVSIPKKEQIKAAQEASEAAEAEQQESGANTTETVDGLMQREESDSRAWRSIEGNGRKCQGRQKKFR